MTMEGNNDDKRDEDIALDNNQENDADVESDIEDDENEIMEMKDDAELLFDEHKGHVFVVDVDPVLGHLVCSGGEDDTAYVWRRDTGKIVFECVGHKESVTSVTFNKDSSLLATADMSGLMQVWDMKHNNLYWDFEVEQIQWMSFHPVVSSILFAGTIDGTVWMWNLTTKDYKTMRGHGSSCECGVVLKCGKKIACGYEDGTVKIWDLQTTNHLHTLNGVHIECITCIATSSQNDIIASGSTDGITRIIHGTSGKVLATFNVNNKRDPDIEYSVESLAFTNSTNNVINTPQLTPPSPPLSTPPLLTPTSTDPSMNLLAIGSLDGVLTLWDPSSNNIRHSCKHTSGIVKCKWAESSPFVFSINLAGDVNQWDARDGAHLQTWTGHAECILDFVVSTVGEFIVTSSEDNTCRIFSMIKVDR